MTHSDEVWWGDVTDDENGEVVGGRVRSLSLWNQYSFLTHYCLSFIRRPKIRNAEQKDMEPCVWKWTDNAEQKNDNKYL